MLTIDETAAHLSHSQGAYFDGSLELLRELAVTSDVDAALPRLSAIVEQDAAARCLAHGVLRSAGATDRERVDRRRARHDGGRRRRGDHR